MKQLLDSLSRFNRQEQTMIVAGSIVVFLYLLWIVLLAPLQRKVDRLTLTNVATTQSLGRVQLMAQKLEGLSQLSQGGAGGDNLSGLVDSSLRENGLSMSNFSPSPGGEARIRIDKASSEALMQWLYDLETKHFVAIRELSITASNDPGQVSVNVRLQKP
jgi:general secretion pathway protein M